MSDTEGTLLEASSFAPRAFKWAKPKDQQGNIMLGTDVYLSLDQVSTWATHDGGRVLEVFMSFGGQFVTDDLLTVKRWLDLWETV